MDEEAAQVDGTDEVVAQVSEAEAGMPDVGDTDAEHDDDIRAKPQDVLVDAVIDHGGDVVSEQRRNHPAQRFGAHQSTAEVGQSSAGRCSGAIAPGIPSGGSSIEPTDYLGHPTLQLRAPADRSSSDQLAPASQALSVTNGARYGRDFFAEILDWDCDALVPKLVHYVVGAHSLSMRTDFAAVVRDGAAKHVIDGRVIFRCKRLSRTADNLLGDWSSREGLRDSVCCCIEDAQRFSL